MQILFYYKMCGIKLARTDSSFILTFINSEADFCADLHRSGVFLNFNYEGVFLGSWRLIISHPKILRRNRFSYFRRLIKYSSQKRTFLITTRKSTIILKIDLETRLSSVYPNSGLTNSFLVFIFQLHVSKVI